MRSNRAPARVVAASSAAYSWSGLLVAVGALYLSDALDPLYDPARVSEREDEGWRNCALEPLEARSLKRCPPSC